MGTDVVANPKFCAYGAIYLDHKGIILKEEGSGALIQYENSRWSDWWEKGFYKAFDTEAERDAWIKSQNYQYDDR